MTKRNTKGDLDWPAIGKRLEALFAPAVDAFSKRKFDGLIVDVRLVKYPPRITLDVGVLSIGSRRAEDYSMGVPIYAIRTDEELMRCGDVPVVLLEDVQKRAGEDAPKLRAFRAPTVKRGVSSYVIKPADYAEWE